MKIYKIIKKGIETNRWYSDSGMDETHYEESFGLPERSELDEEGNPTGKILPAEYTIEIEDITAQVEQQKINEESLAYLASTDWMIIREMDQGTPCPADVKQKRAEARAKIVR